MAKLKRRSLKKPRLVWSVKPVTKIVPDKRRQPPRYRDTMVGEPARCRSPFEAE